MRFVKVEVALAADSWEKGVSLTKPAHTACTSVREHSSQLEKGKGGFLALASCFLNLASLRGRCRFLGLEKWRARKAINTDSLYSSSSWMISSGHWCLYLVCPTIKWRLYPVKEVFQTHVKHHGWVDCS